jgi:hypothetical protein
MKAIFSTIKMAFDIGVDTLVNAKDEKDNQSINIQFSRNLRIKITGRLPKEQPQHNPKVSMCFNNIQ